MKAKTESSEQIRFVNRVRQFYPDVLIFAIPNGGGRSPMEATKLKEEGVLAGVPDLFVAHPIGIWHGAFFEMKKAKGGRVSKEQEAMLDRLHGLRYAAYLCHGCDEAWECFEDYMSVYKG